MADADVDLGRLRDERPDMTSSFDEIREKLDLPPWAETCGPVVFTPQGPVPFSQTQELIRKMLEGRGEVRTFETGATRDTTAGKHEPWGFMSALAESRFCEYMTKHRVQADGSLRASDNWKQGIPVEVYAHSLSRHVQDLRLILEGFPEQAVEDDVEEVLCAVLFNVQGMLHETVKARLPALALPHVGPSDGGVPPVLPAGFAAAAAAEVQPAEA